MKNHPLRFLGKFSFRHMGFDALLLFFSLYASLYLRLGEAHISQHLSVLNQLAAPFVILKLFTFLALGVYQSMWRYISTFDAIRLAKASLLSMTFMIVLTYLMTEVGYLPRSFFVIDALLSTALLMSARLARRSLFERQMLPSKTQAPLGKLVIYGAGQNGRLLAQRLLSDPQRDRELLGFIDDDRHKHDKLIHGLPVLGNHAEMENLLVQSGATDLVVAITHPPADLMREIVVLGRKLNVRVQRIAHFDAPRILSQSEALYRQVELKDLLNRPAAQIDVPSVKDLISGKTILVTGAGGSIGSELCRQIARHSPASLLLLDHSEFNLYEIDRELRPKTQDFDSVIPVLVDIKDLKSLENVFKKHRPQVVFHAAAYKHVHLVEANVASSVLNNVQGTWNLLKQCEASGVEKFVMISTDKAVNPVGAMGSTKRVCELLTSEFGQRTRKNYSSVRFGNVLGSSGSLIPVLTEQINAGGPVMLTHPEMNRYFMLIPEAVSLVLMSATLSKPGDINVLKMGEPMMILELAKSLIALMGKSEEEIGIAFTGIRPGEKMFEELYLTGSELETRHPDILTVPDVDPASLNLEVKVQKLIHLASQGESSLLPFLLKLANEKPQRSNVAAVFTADLVKSMGHLPE
jgi:FlaA1/EpsC-like NDP-sugar epimerase